MALESRDMMKDRVYGITQTIFHAPNYTRHVLNPCRVMAVGGNLVHAQTHYAVFRAKPGVLGGFGGLDGLGGVNEVYNVRRYVDVIEKAGALFMPF